MSIIFIFYNIIMDLITSLFGNKEGYRGGGGGGGGGRGGGGGGGGGRSGGGRAS